ncbi:UNVERIFIED_CONTAM: hypothetical protein Sradi_1540300 [Sesamum radiatum]|uniref:RNase H type-1 domain-containing protein n=1 Tax=Sesamum radiatum TaxID=300843 RepID=A0AAW2UC64_SESRA
MECSQDFYDIPDTHCICDLPDSDCSRSGGQKLCGWDPVMGYFRWEQLGRLSVWLHLGDNFWRISGIALYGRRCQFFLWRLFHDRIPVDARMKQKGFSFPSKCQCCAVEETIPHLFVQSSVVQGVWQYFARFFGLPICETGDLTHLVHFWRYSTPFHSDLHIRTLVPFLILWFTWTQQNAAKYDGARFLAANIIFEVDRHLRTLYAAWILTSTQWKGDLYRAVAMGFIFMLTVPRAPRVVRWTTPSPTSFKLNSDGSSLGNPGPAGAAGIITDAEGQVLLVYQDALGTATSVIAELTAVWRGLEMALAHGWPHCGGRYDSD